MILRLGLDDTLGGDQLRGLGHARLERHLHGAHEGLADVPHHLAPGGLGLRIELERLEQLEHDLLVVLGLLEILLPFLLQLVVLDAAERRLVHGDAALLGLERLIEELVDLFHLQGLGHGRYLVSGLVVAKRVFSLWHGGTRPRPVPFRWRLARQKQPSASSIPPPWALASHRSRLRDRTTWLVMCKASTTSRKADFLGQSMAGPVTLTCERHPGHRQLLAGRGREAAGSPSVGSTCHPAPGRTIQAFRSFFPGAGFLGDELRKR